MTLTAKDVAEITRLLEESSFDELYLEIDGLKLSLKRGAAVNGRAAAGEATPQPAPRVAQADAVTPTDPVRPGLRPGPASAVGSVSAAGPTAAPGPNAAASVNAAAGPNAAVGPNAAAGPNAAVGPDTVTRAQAASPSSSAAALRPPDTNSAVKEVRAPLLGTFYRAPKPGAPPFVEVGAEVEEDTIIGILEVMKLMNTIRAGLRGKVTEILARDGTLVEYGEPLMRVSVSISGVT